VQYAFVSVYQIGHVKGGVLVTQIGGGMILYRRHNFCQEIAMRTICRCLALSLFAIASLQAAAEEYRPIKSVFCDTAEQMQEVVRASDAKKAVEAINRRANTKACRESTAFITRVQLIGQAGNSGRIFSIFRADVAGGVLSDAGDSLTIAITPGAEQFFARRLQGWGI
jgi:hypothetical protein